MSVLPRPRLVLFDFDGTLVDSQHSIVQAFAAACRDHAIDDVDPTAIRRSIGLRTADDGPGKPDPFMVLSALDETGIDAADAVMIGDTVFDMAMAASAGISAIGVGWGYHPPEELAKAGALAVVDGFDALLETLKQRGFHA